MVIAASYSAVNSESTTLGEGDDTPAKKLGLAGGIKVYLARMLFHWSMFVF